LKKFTNFFILTAYLLLPFVSPAQTDPSLIDMRVAPPGKFYSRLSDKIEGVSQQFDKRTEKLLRKIEAQESRIYKQLWKKDSLAAKELIGNARERYASLKENAKQQAGRLGRFSQVYSGKLDSLSTAFRFLEDNKLISPALKDKVTGSTEALKALQDKFNQANIIRKFVKERRELLASQLEKFGLTKELKLLNKQVYYYQQQLREYKELWEHSDKLTAKLLQVLSRTNVFKNFFAKNSQLGSLFNLGGTAGTDPVLLAGLQTRSSVLQDLQGRLGSNSAVQQLLQQNMQSAQSQLNALKDKVNYHMPRGGSNDDIMPETFKPNNQKTKTFFQRLEYGTNFQSQRQGGYFPITSDVGLSLGYKLNDKSVIGIGASYKIGWGQNIRNINISSQGAALRSFADMKLKGSFWISGGYEMNYRSAFNRIAELKNLNAWQQSGLVGVSKVVSLQTKFFKKTKVQLLWDFLSYHQVPRTQPLVFRVGYNIK
jgi:hypothetical protein